MLRRGYGAVLLALLAANSVASFNLKCECDPNIKIDCSARYGSLPLSKYEDPFSSPWECARFRRQQFSRQILVLRLWERAPRKRNFRDVHNAPPGCCLLVTCKSTMRSSLDFLELGTRPANSGRELRPLSTCRRAGKRSRPEHSRGRTLLHFHRIRTFPSPKSWSAPPVMSFIVNKTSINFEVLYDVD